MYDPLPSKECCCSISTFRSKKGIVEQNLKNFGEFHESTYAARYGTVSACVSSFLPYLQLLVYSHYLIRIKRVNLKRYILTGSI